MLVESRVGTAVGGGGLTEEGSWLRRSRKSGPVGLLGWLTGHCGRKACRLIGLLLPPPAGIKPRGAAGKCNCAGSRSRSDWVAASIQ